VHLLHPVNYGQIWLRNNAMWLWCSLSAPTSKMMMGLLLDNLS